MRSAYSAAVFTVSLNVELYDANACCLLATAFMASVKDFHFDPTKLAAVSPAAPKTAFPFCRTARRAAA